MSARFIGRSEKFVGMKLIAGPCVIEGYSFLLDVAWEIKQIVQRHPWIDEFYFKSSFDKANRTSAGSFRGVGEMGLGVLNDIRLGQGTMVLTDVHETHQVKLASRVCSALQIPAMLCRQTDLIAAAGQTGLPLNIKKGQWMSATDMLQVYKKAKTLAQAHEQPIWLCERGNAFGYNRLVVDYGNLVDMARQAPVIFDCTHSVQQPGAHGERSGGRRDLIPFLARAAAATGVLSGFFMEVHPDPANAKSDPDTQIPLNQLDSLLTGLGEILEVS